MRATYGKGSHVADLPPISLALFLSISLTLPSLSLSLSLSLTHSLSLCEQAASNMSECGEIRAGEAIALNFSGAVPSPRT